MPTPRARPLVVALEGASGVGKSRTASWLAASTGATVLGEAYDRITPRPPLHVGDPPALLRLEGTLLREEGRRFREACEIRDAGRIVVVDTGFLGPISYSIGLARLAPTGPTVATLLARARRAALTGTWGFADLTLYLDAPGDVVARRSASDPRAHPIRWRRRHRAVARVERELWIEALARPLGRRFARVDASGSPEVATAATMAAFRSLPRAPPLGRRMTLRLLEDVATFGHIGNR